MVEHRPIAKGVGNVHISTHNQCVVGFIVLTALPQFLKARNSVMFPSLYAGRMSDFFRDQLGVQLCLPRAPPNLDSSWSF
jgi:hypothetical protein